MKNKKIILLLLCAPLVTMMCAWSTRLNFTAANSAQCTGLRIFEYGETRREITCSITCPVSGQSVQIAAGEEDVTEEALLEKYCSLAVTEVPAEPAPPTATPTATPGGDPAPLLTGEVTLCDTVHGVLNLRLVEGYDAQQFSSLAVTVGGQAVTCAVNPSNPTIYTCSLPALQTFPAQVQLTAGGLTLDEFPFDGAGCIGPNEPKDDGKDDVKDDAPPAPVDCIADPLSPQC